MSRPSFAKQDRERAKRAKAEAKRERRLSGDTDSGADAAEETTGSSAYAGLSTPELLQLIEDLHRRHADGLVSDDEFHTTKAELLGQLQVD